MKTKQVHPKFGFTLIELLVLIAIMAILAAMIHVPRSSAKVNARRIACISHLKQIGMSFRIWAADHNDLSPMNTSVTNGGVMELAQTGNVAAVFQVMSNELNTPKLLFCPTDKIRTPATMFTATQPGNTNISYFVNLDAVDTNPSMFLSGDDNLLIGGNPRDSLSGALAAPGVLTLTTNSLMAWSQTRHEKQGNIGLADGSVQGFSTATLRRAWEQSGVATNRLAMP